MKKGTKQVLLVGGAAAVLGLLLSKRANANDKLPVGSGQAGGQDPDDEGFGGYYADYFPQQTEQRQQEQVAPEEQTFLQFLTSIESDYRTDPDVPMVDPYGILAPNRLAVVGKQVDQPVLFNSEMFGEVATTPQGIAPLTDAQGNIVGAYDLVNMQSVSPESNPEMFSALQSSGGKSSVTPTLASTAPSNDPSYAGAQNMSTVPYSPAQENTLLAASLVSRDTAKPVTNRFGKMFASEAGEGVVKRSLKTTGKLGVKAVPYAGLAAGTAIDSVDYPVPVAFAGNLVGDLLGTVGALGGGAAGALAGGVGAPVGAVAGGVGGQVLGEQIVFKPWSWLFGDKDDEETTTAAVQQPLYSTPNAEVNASFPTTGGSRSNNSRNFSSVAQISSFERPDSKFAGGSVSDIQKLQSAGAGEQQIQSFVRTGEMPAMRKMLGRGVVIDLFTGSIAFDYGVARMEQYQKYGVTSDAELAQKLDGESLSRAREKISYRVKKDRDKYKSNKRKGRYDREVNAVRATLGKPETSYKEDKRSTTRANTSTGQYTQESISNLRSSPNQNYTPANANFSHESGAQVYVAPPTPKTQPVQNSTPSNANFSSVDGTSKYVPPR